MDLWQRLADGLRDALVAFDRDLRLVAVNAPAAAILGATPAELTGTRLAARSASAAAELEPFVFRAFDEHKVFVNDLHPFGDGEAYTIFAERVNGEELVTVTLHRERNGDWPTDTGWAHRELAFANRQLRAYTDNTSLGFVRSDSALRVLEWSSRAERIFGWTFDEVRGRTLVELGLVYPDDVARVGELTEALLRGEATNVSENRNVTKDGRVIHCRWFNSAIPIDGGRHQLASLVDDVTDLVHAERQVAAHSDRLRELYLVAASANATAENLIAATIDAGCRLLGMTAGSLYDAEADRSVATVGDPIPRRLARLSLATDGALALEDLRGLPYLTEPEFGEEPPRAYIGTAIDIGGARYGSLCFAANARRDEEFTPGDRDLVQLMGALVGSAIERGRARARLKHLAYNDQLTALPNRAWFTERLRDELALASEAGTRVAVMFLDLDRFKDINDTLGHALGDRMLRVIGDRLTSVVGSEGLVARMGGDEFIVLVGADPQTARIETLATRIINAIDEPLVFDGYEQFVTTSIGIAVYPDDGDDADTLIKNADVAMYRAKERGRNTHQFFTPALGASLRTRISQEKSLRKALEREEFVLHYQPQYELGSGRLCSFEALVRWQHPRLGLIGPDQFIPSAEMSGLIVGLGDWVLETASRQVRAWQTTVPDLHLAVNLSARQFHQTALAAKIADILARTGLCAGHLELEITETIAMSDAALSRQILDELRRAGVRLAVDDFGTGYSSLGYLRRFPIDTLKIDKSFVREIMAEPDDATIVRTVIGMAHSLGLEVCAEGVETAEQVAFLTAERCDRVQGFFYGRPVAVEQVPALLAGRGNPAAVG
ncbi:MAG TPA: EAL domain-containing protein [Candidatus Elarobacter sp.]|nr:EAL domain-containing protein [Candidatus Elarobacter sp.]